MNAKTSPMTTRAAVPPSKPLLLRHPARGVGVSAPSSVIRQEPTGPREPGSRRGAPLWEARRPGGREDACCDQEHGGERDEEERDLFLARLAAEAGAHVRVRGLERLGVPGLRE